MQVISVYTNVNPALAVIQRSSGRTDYVLRETGQVIGDEFGPGDFWQEVLHMSTFSAPPSV